MGPGDAGTFDWCPATHGDVSIRDVQRLVSDLRRTTRRAVPPPGSLHTVAFAGGLLILALGLAGWAFQGGPGALWDIVLVLDLTIGGTLLLTGALVGRARASEARRNGQLEVLQHAARRMSANLTPAEVGRAVVEETRRIIDYHNARVYLIEPPDDVVPDRVRGTVGAYEQVDFELLRSAARRGLHGLGRAARRAAPRQRRERRSARRDDPGHRRRRRVDARRPDALRRPPSIGVITLSKLGLDQFDDEDLRLLLILADQAATAVESPACSTRARPRRASCAGCST